MFGVRQAVTEFFLTSCIRSGGTVFGVRQAVTEFFLTLCIRSGGLTRRDSRKHFQTKGSIVRHNTLLAIIR